MDHHISAVYFERNVSAKHLNIIDTVATPWIQDVNWTYIKSSEDVQTSPERFMWIQFSSCI